MKDDLLDHNINLQEELKKLKISQVLLNVKYCDLKERINLAIKYIESFQSYIPEDCKPELLDILRSKIENENTKGD